MSKLGRILLAEDDDRDMELTMAALDEINLANDVVRVHDGAETLDYLFYRGKFESRSNGLPLVILLDLKMPKVSGLEVLKQIKTDSKLKLIPVVMLTSSREDRDVVESYRLGVNAYVVKPVDFEQFNQAVKDLGLFWCITNESPPQPKVGK